MPQNWTRPGRIILCHVGGGPLWVVIWILVSIEKCLVYFLVVLKEIHGLLMTRSKFKQCHPWILTPPNSPSVPPQQYCFIWLKLSIDHICSIDHIWEGSYFIQREKESEKLECRIWLHISRRSASWSVVNKIGRSTLLIISQIWNLQTAGHD